MCMSYFTSFQVLDRLVACSAWELARWERQPSLIELWLENHINLWSKNAGQS